MVAVIRRTAPIRARAAIRLAVPKQKKVQPPGMRIKAPKRKKKTRARAEIGSWFKDYEILAVKLGKAYV